MRKITAIVCLLVAIIASAQYTNPGFYRVHSANTDAYISIKGTKYVFSSKPNAFWSCILMLKDSAQVSDPGSIIYIPRLEQTSLCAQGVSTYTLTDMWMDVAPAKENEISAIVNDMLDGVPPTPTIDEVTDAVDKKLK